MSIKRSIVIGETAPAPTKDKVAVLKGTQNTSKNTIVRSIDLEQPVLPPRVFNKKGKILVIVESPAKSKTIEKYLGSNYIVKASMGHLRDLPKSNMGIDIDHNFTPRYANLFAKKALIEDLQKEADKSSAVLLATDPDREGEAISWHLATILNLDKESDCRITFNEITGSAVEAAIKAPRSLDFNMVDAQQARRIVDRLVGYKVSPILWKKICKGLSAGRVQSVAVRLICEREREIAAFIPEEYWSIEGNYQTKSKDKFVAELTHHQEEKINITSEKEALVITQALDKKEGTVTKVEKKKRSRKAAPPFTTSTLQQEGVRKLNFGAKRTMMIAQHLYEGKSIGSYGQVGLITYMRTDSTRISKEMQEEARAYILNRYGKDFYPSKPNVYGAKQNSQDAHEAIRPTSLYLTPAVVEPFLTKEELKLYTLIWNRFIASQMAPQIAESLTIFLAVEDYQLKATGSKVLFPGFTEVYDENKKEEATVLPHLEVGDKVNNIDIKGIQHFTQPPARYTEASLIKTLEEKGIGRPSTYAPTLDTIQNRNYVEKKERQFYPTELGFAVVDFLVAHFSKLINVDFTAHLEEALDDIAEGKDTYLSVVKSFYDAFVQELGAANEVERVKLVDEESDEICEKCGSAMVYKYGRYGKFLACSNYPSCTNTKAITVSTGVKCPKCKEGELLERKSRRGRIFYSCSCYPTCDFTLWEKPIDATCEVCGSLLVEKNYKNGQVKRYCSNESCSTRPPKRTRKKKDEGNKE